MDKEFSFLIQETERLLQMPRRQSRLQMKGRSREDKDSFQGSDVLVQLGPGRKRLGLLVLSVFQHQDSGIQDG